MQSNQKMNILNFNFKKKSQNSDISTISQNKQTTNNQKIVLIKKNQNINQIKKNNNCIFCKKYIIYKTLGPLLSKALYYKYATNQNYYYQKDINNILNEVNTPVTIQYKDINILDEDEEYLKRFYARSEFKFKISSLTEYYKYHQDIPRLFMLKQAKTMIKYHHIRRKIQYIQIKKELNLESSFSEQSSHIQNISQKNELKNELINNQIPIFQNLDISSYHFNQNEEKNELKVVQSKQQELINILNNVSFNNKNDQMEFNVSEYSSLSIILNNKDDYEFCQFTLSRDDIEEKNMNPIQILMQQLKQKQQQSNQFKKQNQIDKKFLNINQCIQNMVMIQKLQQKQKQSEISSLNQNELKLQNQAKICKDKSANNTQNQQQEKQNELYNQFQKEQQQKKLNEQYNNQLTQNIQEGKKQIKEKRFSQNLEFLQSQLEQSKLQKNQVQIENNNINEKHKSNQNSKQSSIDNKKKLILTPHKSNQKLNQRYSKNTPDTILRQRKQKVYSGLFQQLSIRGNFTDRNIIQNPIKNDSLQNKLQNQLNIDKIYQNSLIQYKLNRSKINNDINKNNFDESNNITNNSKILIVNTNKNTSSNLIKSHNNSNKSINLQKSNIQCDQKKTHKKSNSLNPNIILNLNRSKQNSIKKASKQINIQKLLDQYKILSSRTKSVQHIRNAQQKQGPFPRAQSNELLKQNHFVQQEYKSINNQPKNNEQNSYKKQFMKKVLSQNTNTNVTNSINQKQTLQSSSLQASKNTSMVNIFLDNKKNHIKTNSLVQPLNINTINVNIISNLQAKPQQQKNNFQKSSDRLDRQKNSQSKQLK